MNESPVRMIEAPPPQLFPIIGEEGTGGAQPCPLMGEEGIGRIQFSTLTMERGADNFLLLFGGTEVGGL